MHRLSLRHILRNGLAFSTRIISRAAIRMRTWAVN